jgi:hypothetical protein
MGHGRPGNLLRRIMPPPAPPRNVAPDHDCISGKRNATSLANPVRAGKLALSRPTTWRCP